MVTDRVYFVREGAVGPIKIGHAFNVAKRLATMQTANPRALRLLREVDGGRERERELHARFSHLRIRGEWFRPDPYLLGFIEAPQRAEYDAFDAHTWGEEALWLDFVRPSEAEERDDPPELDHELLLADDDSLARSIAVAEVLG